MTIRNRFDKKSIFSFKEIGKTEVIKEIKNLSIKKGSLSSDIPTKIIKESDDLFAIFITENFNLCLKKGKFAEILKIVEVTPIYKKENRSRKTTTDQLAFCLMFQKFMRELSIIK